MKIRVKSNPKLGDLIEIKLKNENADFWLTRRGSIEKLGKPTRDYNPESFGITVRDDAKDILDPSYLYYMMEHLWSQGLWQRLSKGSVIKFITKEDIANIPIGTN